MEDEKIKSLTRQRSALIGTIVLLVFVTLVSMVYAYVQHGIAEENFQLAKEYEQRARVYETKALKSAEEARRQMLIAEKNAREAEAQLERLRH
jgi:hypothetical protein